MSELRRDLPETTPRIARLPVHRGYPVPWFVAWLDGGDPPKALPRGQGTPDFRVLAPDAILRAYRDRRCWICGQLLGVHLAFVGGPMCAVSRTSSEPPSHLDCARWAVRACPFMARPHMERREAGLPEEAGPGAGIMLMRNPGASFVWTTRSYSAFPDRDGKALFRMGEPDEVEWYARGRQATREEVEESVAGGLPALRELAEAQAGGLEELDRMLEEFGRLLPT